MPALDRSRPARMALALFGLVGAGVLGVILGVVREAGWLSLLFTLAFALALLLEIGGRWRETTRPSRRRLRRRFRLSWEWLSSRWSRIAKDGRRFFSSWCS
jgi:hypothetical protein